MSRRNFSLQQQRGAALLEALMAIFIFSVGIIALMGLQAVSIKNSIDAKYRADAAYLANQIIAQMWVDRGNLATYAYRPDQAVCATSDAIPNNANVVGWLNQIAATLPGAPGTRQQIIVDAPAALPNSRQVTVRVCWQGPQEQVSHNFVAIAELNLP